jgi:hypothetical protein
LLHVFLNLKKERNVLQVKGKAVLEQELRVVDDADKIARRSTRWSRSARKPPAAYSARANRVVLCQSTSSIPEAFSSPRAAQCMNVGLSGFLTYLFFLTTMKTP